MSDEPGKVPASDAFASLIGAKATRKLNARHSTQDVWSGLGMIGLIGWSVVVPMLLGAAIGLWVDKHHPGGHSWTLALLIFGLAVGCLKAWHWVANEQSAMHHELEHPNE